MILKCVIIITATPTEAPNEIYDNPKNSLKTTPTKIDTKWPKKILAGCAVSNSYNTNTKKTVAPKENINHIPAEVSKVKKASNAITNEADKPEKIVSNFFFIFICVYDKLGYIQLWN